jgi:hypothetical protein
MKYLKYFKIFEGELSKDDVQKLDSIKAILQEIGDVVTADMEMEKLSGKTTRYVKNWLLNLKLDFDDDISNKYGKVSNKKLISMELEELINSL